MLRLPHKPHRAPRRPAIHPIAFLRIPLSLALAFFALAGPAHAVDGVRLINQTIANNGNVTPGDEPGFPVTISRAGSYRLSGNLTVPNVNTTAIEITADDVTLDLNGFAIIGPTVCSIPGLQVICSPTGSGSGVFAAFGVDNITVINGSVRGMGSKGVDLRGRFNRVENVHARSNGTVGIFVNFGSMVVGNRATLNGQTGMFALDSTVTGNTVAQNGGAGIATGFGAPFGGLVAGNTAKLNDGVGLELGSLTGYTQNVLTGNNGGNDNPQVLGGIQMGTTNVCGTDRVCP